MDFLVFESNTLYKIVIF